MRIVITTILFYLSITIEYALISNQIIGMISIIVDHWNNVLYVYIVHMKQFVVCSKEVGVE